MPKRTKVAGTATPEQVQAALKTYKKPHEQKRLLALKMAQQGQFTRAQIGDALNKSRATIGRWLKAYLSGGIQALLKRGHGGKQPTLQPDDIDALKDGLRSGQFKTAKQIANWLEKERGIQMKKSGIYYWLDKVKAQRASKSTCQARPRPERGLQTKHCRPARRLGDSKRLSDTHLGRR
jgi:transposase